MVEAVQLSQPGGQFAEQGDRKMAKRKRRAAKAAAAKRAHRKIAKKKIATKKLVRKQATTTKVAGKSGARAKSKWQKTVAAFLRAAVKHKKELTGAHEPIAGGAFRADLAAAPATQAPGSCTIQPPIDGVEGRCVDGVTQDFCDRMGAQFRVKAIFVPGGKCPPG